MTLVLGNHEAQAVLDECLLALLLEVETEVRGERRLQTGVTHGDRQGVGVVVDVEQLRDAGLRHRTTILYLQVGVLVEAIAQVEGGRDVNHRAHGIDGLAQILLDVVRALRLQVHT